MMKKNFVVFILAVGIILMKITRKNLRVLILAVAILASASIVGFTSFRTNGTVLGITLGKSLGAVGLRECRRTEGPYSFKEYDSEDTCCYQINEHGSDGCLIRIIPELSFDMKVEVLLLNNRDLRSPVQEIRATFNSNNYERVSPLMIAKFGQPKKVEKSIAQNSMGVNIQKMESYWNKRGLSMYLTNIQNETDFGLLQIIGQDKKRGLALRSREERASDLKTFTFLEYGKGG